MPRRIATFSATGAINMGINKDQVEGRVKEATGKVQEVAGRTVGSTKEELKGNLNKNKGKAQAALGDAEEQVKKSLDRP
jgi:uncharacterized protein YjbJ (UPF0337 family)